MAEREQLGRDIAKRHRVATVKALAQGLGQGDDLGPCLGVALATLHLVTVGALALAGAAQLRDQHRLFKFRDAAENLTDQPRSRRIVEECIGAIGSNKGDAALLEHGKADFLHHQVAGEAVGGLDHNGANAVAEQALQHRLEAGPCVDVIGAGNRLVVVLVDDLNASPLGVGGNGGALPLVGVPVGPMERGCAGPRGTGKPLGIAVDGVPGTTEATRDAGRPRRLTGERQSYSSSGGSPHLSALSWQTAYREHDAETEFGRVANKAAIDSATETLKAIVLINGGSCVAILTFIGTLATKDKVPIGLATPLIWFAVGLVMTVIASALGHFTNLFIAKTSKSMTPEYERPFLRDNDESKRYRHCGEWA